MTSVDEELSGDEPDGLGDLDAEGLVRRALDVVNTAKTMPLSASVLISRDEVSGLLATALERLPDELRQARWLLREREEFLAERTREADALMEEVRVQAERMVSRTEVVRQANLKGQRILHEANEESRRMRHETEDYCDQKLAGMEIVLDRIMKTVRSGREKLQATTPPPGDTGAPPPDPRGGAAARRRRFLRPGSGVTESVPREGPMPVDPFVVHVARLRRAPGIRRHEVRQGSIEAVEELGAKNPVETAVPPGAEVVCDVVLESYPGGIMATGTVTAPWRGACRRCTRTVEGELSVKVRERFVPPEAGEPEDVEAYVLEGDELDLSPLVRDAVLLELPLAPAVRRGLPGALPQCGADRNEEECLCATPTDPRWANLDVLR